MTGWAEGCPCHWACSSKAGGLRGPQRWEDSTSKIRRSGSNSLRSGQSCPLATLRAPEVASGDFLHYAEALLDSSHRCLLTQADFARLCEEDKNTVLTDFFVGRRFLRFNLQCKLSHWDQLPWCLIGLGHAEQRKARLAAARALQLWDSELGNAQTKQHGVAEALLSPGTAARDQIVHFAGSDTPLDQFPELLMFAAKAFFVTVAERWIESRHALASRFLKLAPHASQTTFAISVRVSRTP